MLKGSIKKKNVKGRARHASQFIERPATQSTIVSSSIVIEHKDHVDLL